MGWFLVVNLDAYHLGRAIEHQPFHSACYAPFVGLSFDMTGSVSVCAFTRTKPLGRVGETPLMEMWRGERISRLRQAVVADDLSYACSRCAEEIAGGNLSGSLAVGFDQFTASADPEWPTRMEFALSTACNLQCVMCSGEFSSSIRAHREGLPPLPQSYGDEFLEELDPFLPHLQQARFLGGEPFLAEINFRIWERMIELGLQVECNVTTNGTQWTPRVQRVLEQLPFSIGISIDGTTPETVELIRSGGSYDRIMENLGHFVAYRDRHESSLSLTFCLMIENAHEFVDYLLMAEDLGCQVYVNTVRQPVRHSLFQLPPAELQDVLSRMEIQAAAVEGRLALNAAALHEQLARLRSHLDTALGTPVEFARASTEQTRFQDLVDCLSEPDLEEAALIALLQKASANHTAGLDAVSVLRCDAAEQILQGNHYVGLSPEQFVSAHASVLHPMLAEHLGHRIDVVADQSGNGSSTRVLSFCEPGAEPSIMITMARRGPDPWSTTRYATLLHSGDSRLSNGDR
ncbi:radical SAM superfamily enzyme [Actinobacteria bacterium IMCC26207]|nr:radical SAM superfamily enzyme [Actinobacteria bacterium IMCC26207]